MANSPAGEPVREPEAGAAPAEVDRTVPMLLSDPALDGGTELLGATPVARSGTGPNGEPTTIGLAPGSEPGRADNFSWPPAAPAKPATETTGATKP